MGRLDSLRLFPFEEIRREMSLGMSLEQDLSPRLGCGDMEGH